MKILLLTTLLAAGSGPVDDWYFERAVDPITGLDNSMTYTPSRDGSTVLAVKCDGDDPVALVSNTARYGTDLAQVVYRFDGEPHQEELWRVDEMPNGDLLLNYDPGFLEKMRSGVRLLFRSFDYQGRVKGSHEFSLIGSFDATGLLACGGGK